MAELPPPQHDPDEVRRAAEEILAGKEFQPPGRSLLERFADWISSPFDESEVSGSSSPGSGGSSFLTLLFLALAVVVVVLLVRALLRHRRGPKRGADPVTIDVEEVRTADQWDAAAAAHEAEGRWKEGLRCRFAALVGRLVDRGAVPPTPGRTARELAVDLGATRPAAVAPFDDAARLFERVWYGGEATGPSEAEHLGALAAEVLAAPSPEPTEPEPELVA